MAPTFLVLYGDTFFDVNLAAIWKAHARSGADLTLFLHPNDHPQDSDLVDIDATGKVVSIHPYPHPAGQHFRNLVNAGLYVVTQAGMAGCLPAQGMEDLAKHAFPRALAGGRHLHAYVSPEYIKDIGTPERLDRVVSHIQAGLVDERSDRRLRSAIFLDRDGTLNLEVGHLKKAEDLVLLPGAAEAVSRINQSGSLAVCITNQPVLARGDVDQAGLQAIHARLEALLGQGHAYLDAIYTCPHHPDRGFPGEVPELKMDCLCRKPEPGLILQASRELAIDPARSWMVGDSSSDIKAGQAAGLSTILVRTGLAGRDGKYKVKPDYTVPDLPAAIDWCLQGHAAMVKALLPLAAQRFQDRVVLIGGLSRSGKTSAAQVLKELLALGGRKSQVICLDAWLRPAAERSEGSGVLARYDLDGVASLVQRLKHAPARIALDLPVYDPFTRNPIPAADSVSIGPGDMIIVEGVPALAHGPLRELADSTLYVQAPEDLRRARIVRDYLTRGWSPEAIQEMLGMRDQDESPFIIHSSANVDYRIQLGVSE